MLLLLLESLFLFCDRRACLQTMSMVLLRGSRVDLCWASCFTLMPYVAYTTHTTWLSSALVSILLLQIILRVCRSLLICRDDLLS